MKHIGKSGAAVAAAAFALAVTGAGIVADSVPATEYQETVNKAHAVAVAIQRAEEGLG